MNETTDAEDKGLLLPFHRHMQFAHRIFERMLERFPQPIDRLVVLEIILAGTIGSTALGDTVLQAQCLDAVVNGVKNRLSDFTKSLGAADVKSN